MAKQDRMSTPNHSKAHTRNHPEMSDSQLRSRIAGGGRFRADGHGQHSVDGGGNSKHRSGKRKGY